MNELELKELALDGLKYLRKKSKSFKKDLSKIKKENPEAIKKLSAFYKENSPEIIKNNQKKLTLALSHFKNIHDSDCEKLFLEMEAFQKKFHLDHYPFDLLLELPVFNFFSYRPASYATKTDVPNVTLKVDIQADISREEFNSIWAIDVKPFKKFAKSKGFKIQDGSKDFDLAFRFYEARLEKPEFTNKQLASYVAEKIAKPTAKSVAKKTGIKKLKRTFTESQVTKYIKKAEHYIEGLGLIFGKR